MPRLAVAQVPHTDDSEVTLNVCLGKDFTGGEIIFGTVRGDGGSASGGHGETMTVPPSAGRGVLHLGRHLHGVSPVTGGQRFALVLWARSLEGTRSEICPCCWINRRDRSEGSKGTSCICGPDWN